MFRTVRYLAIRMQSADVRHVSAFQVPVGAALVDLEGGFDAWNGESGAGRVRNRGFVGADRVTLMSETGPCSRTGDRAQWWSDA